MARKTMRWRSLLWWAGMAFAVLLLIVVGIVLSAPLWIDAAAVKAQVVSIVNKVTNGQTRLDRVELHYLPRPGVALTLPAFSLQGTLDFEARSASVDLDLAALLRGHVRPRNIRIDSPKIRVRLPEPEANSAKKDSGSLAQAEQQVRAVLDGIVDRARGAHAEIIDASLELRIGERPPFLLDRIAVDLAVDGDIVAGKLACGSALWERFAADVRVSRKDLAGEGHAQLTGLRAERLGAVLGRSDNWPIAEANLNATLRWQMRGLATVQGDATVSAPKVAMQFGNRRLVAVGASLEAAMSVDNDAIALTLRRLALETPHLEVTAKLSRSQSNGYSLEAEARDADVPDLLAVARDLAPDIDWLARPRALVERGTITSLKVGSRGATVEELLNPAALQASAALNGVEVRVPEFGLKVEGVGATASLTAGDLRIQDITARTGKASVREGWLVTRLDGEPLPLHAEIAIGVDFAEAMALARRAIRDRDTLRQLQRVKRLDGSAVIRITLGERVDLLRTRVDVSALTMSAQHDAIPFPLRIVRGALTYAQDALSIDGLEGAIGQSSFTGLGARVNLKSPYVLSQGHGSAVLALEELFRWAAAQPDLAKPLESVKTVSGGIALTLTKLEGPATSPKALQFQVAATLKQVVVNAPKFGPPVTIDGGTIDLSPRSIGLRGIRVSALDAAVEVGGRTDGYLDGVDNLNVTLGGTVGMKALAWAYARGGVPESLRLRDALKLSGISADWSKGGKVAARGSVGVTGGPVIGFAAGRTGKRVKIDNISVRDDASDLRLGGSFEGTQFDVRFKGRLAGTSLEHVFLRTPAALGTLEGDFSGDGDWTRPARSNVTGFLNGSNIGIPLDLPDPLTIESLALEAKGSLVSIKSLKLVNGQTHVELSGSVDRSGEKYRVDADIRGDTVVIPEAPAKDASTPAVPKPAGDAGTAASRDQPAYRAVEHIPVNGEVRVDIGHLRKGRMEIAPLVGSIALETGRLELRIKSASLCAIALNGGLTAQEGIVKARAQLHARGAEIDQWITCLSDQRMRLTGRLDLDADISTTGEPEALAEKLKGAFSVVASDGRIEKFDTLSKAFELLNVTEAVHGKLPDLRQKGMAYRTATLKGRVQGQTMFVDEAVLDASTAKVAAQGQVDFATRKMDVNVLVAPLQTLNWFLDKIPILRRIMGGTVLALPVHVGGTIEDPRVVPLGTKAVASRLIDIVSNTLKLPVDLVHAVSPEASPNNAEGEPAKQ